MNPSNLKNESIKALMLLRRCIMGASKFLKEEPGEESQQLAALASQSAAESLDILDYYLTGKTDKRLPEVDIAMISEMLNSQGELIVTLSDGVGSKLVITDKNPYVRFEMISRYEESSRKRWRTVNVGRSFPSDDMMVSNQEIVDMLRV